MQGQDAAHPAAPPPSYPPERLYGPTGRPQASDIHQGQQGDCYLLSSMGTLARQQPALVAGAIGYDKATHDYLVTLHDEGGAVRQVRVTQDDLKADASPAGGVLSSARNGPVWPAVVEMAYAKQHERPGEAAGDALHDIGQGGFPGPAMRRLTGSGDEAVTSDARLREMKPDRVYDMLRTALDQGRPVTVDTRYHKPGADGLQQDGLVTGDAKTGGGHAYMLENVSRTGNDIMLTLRNPWGNNNSPQQGVISQNPLVTVPLSKVLENQHLQQIDVGPARLERHAELGRPVRSDDATLDGVMQHMGDPERFRQALRDLATSPEGRAFAAEGGAQLAAQRAAERHPEASQVASRGMSLGR